ncbi:MAG: hypothetical protein J6K32_08740 [Clostridia bacterium]|nr:hypothetical protein [Clostridia bacterium]
MKRIWLAAVLALLCAAGAALWLLLPGSAAPQDLQPEAGRDYARADLAYDEGLRTLRGRETIIADNRSGADLEEIVLRLPMNALDGAGMDVTGVTVNGEAAGSAQDADDPTVLRIARAWPKEERVTIGFTLMVKHPQAEGAAAITLPYLAMAEGGAWRTDAYDGLADRGYARAFDFSVTVDGVCAASMRGARDMSFALAQGCAVRSRQTGGVTLTAYARTAGRARSLLDAGETAIASLAKAGLPYPFPALTLADAQTARREGLPLSGLIVLDAQADRETLIRRVTRLAARQIFGIYVESDPWNAPWLSESLAAAAEMLACRARRGTAAYETRLYEEMEPAFRVTRPYGVTVGAGTAHFGGDGEMTQVLGDQGGAMLLGLEAAMGTEAFTDALTQYIHANAGGIAAQADLEDALQAASGADWSGYLADGLSQ